MRGGLRAHDGTMPRERERGRLDVEPKSPEAGLLPQNTGKNAHHKVERNPDDIQTGSPPNDRCYFDHSLGRATHVGMREKT